MFTTTTFTKQLIQCLSDWQRGGGPELKAKRGARLKEEASKLPLSFRKVPTQCYRKVNLKGGHLLGLGTHYQLTETISAWTKSEEVARGFKRGVPPRGEYTGVIFSIIPPEDSVIVDLAALFAEPAFMEALKEHEGDIVDFDKGTGKWGDSQREVIIEITDLPLKSLYAWAGHSSSELELARMFFGRDPSESEMMTFRQFMSDAGRSVGPAWVTDPEAVARVNDKLRFHAGKLSRIPN